MKMIYLTLILSFIFRVAICPPHQELPIVRTEPINPFETIWKAVCKVESDNNPFALNYEEGAFGIAQIRQCRLNDFNAIYGTHYKLIDMYSPERSKSVFMHYAKELGINNRDRIIRNWNGSGPLTYIYLEKVKKYL
jgi:hypothetical protein